MTATRYGWVIEHDGSPIGEVRLDDLDWHTGQARLAIGIDDPHLLGRGLGSEAIRLVVEHAFVALGLDRVWLRVVEYNTRATRGYRSCGFTVQRREPDAVDIRGRSYDDLIMGLSASNWAQRKRRQEREGARDSI